MIFAYEFILQWEEEGSLYVSIVGEAWSLETKTSHKTKIPFV